MRVGVLAPVARDFWTLSTFPCTTVVTHTGGTDDVRRLGSGVGLQGAGIVRSQRGEGQSRRAMQEETPGQPPCLQESAAEAVVAVGRVLVHPLDSKAGSRERSDHLTERPVELVLLLDGVLAALEVRPAALVLGRPAVSK